MYLFDMQFLMFLLHACPIDGATLYKLYVEKNIGKQIFKTFASYIRDKRSCP